MCVSDHFLEIERGRYTRIKKENEVEDEFHFFWLWCLIPLNLTLFDSQFYPEGLKAYTWNIYKQRTQVK
jgi:hypothetical protein